MSPLRRTAGRALLIAALLAAVALPLSATAEVGSPPLRVVTVGVIDVGCPAGLASPCWDTNTIVVRPGDNLSILADLSTSDVPHNIAIREAGASVEGATYVPPAANGEGTAQRPTTVHFANITVPEGYEGEWRYVCLVHATTMVGTLATPETAAASGAHAEPIHHLGVNFLSYWVGVIAFAILFLVYGATFFLFKYNETPAATDHWDRPGAGDGERRFGAGGATLLALLLAAVLVGVVVYVARLS